MLKKILFPLFLFFFVNIFAVDGMLIKTSDASYRDRWEKTLGKTAPKIAGAGYVFKGQQFFVGVVVVDFKSDKKNISDVSYSLKISDPRGKKYFEKNNLKVLKREIQYKNFVQMSDDFITIAFDFDDAFGMYQVEATVHDNISGEEKVFTSEIELAQIPHYRSIEIPEKETFSEWMSNYYKHQEPEKALPYFLFFSKSPLTEKEDSLLSIMSFFKEIFTQNPYLFTQFSEAYDDADEKSKMLLTLLIYQSVDKDAFKKYFPDKKIQELIKGSEFPNIYGEITKPIYLDMLWSEFYASGKQKPILQLVKTLKFSKFKGSIEAYKKSKKTFECRDKAMKEAIYQAAVWSLESNFRNDILVLNYANWMMVNEDLSDIQKRELGLILVKFR